MLQNSLNNNMKAMTADVAMYTACAVLKEVPVAELPGWHTTALDRPAPTTPCKARCKLLAAYFCLV
jgi:hypothetical protein